jgi:hypothetical protein
VSKTFKIVGGDISDGYHTFDELYEHRCLLFILLCLKVRSQAYWRPHYEGWPLLGLQLPSGQITYHVPEKYLPLFKDKIVQGGPEWDGHTPSDVIFRMYGLAQDLGGAQ